MRATARMRLLVVAATLLSVLVVLALPISGNPQAGSTTANPLKPVSVFFSARDNKGLPVLDLKPEEIEVLEDKKPQKIDSMNLASTMPLSVGLIIDASGSRRDQLPGGERDDAKRFLQVLVKTGAQAYIVVFGERTAVVTDMTADPAALQAGVDKAMQIPPWGRSPLFQAIFRAAQVRLFGREGRKALVVVTDGEDNSSKDTRPGQEGKQFRPDELISELQQHQVVVYFLNLPTRNFPSPRAQERAFNTTNRISQETGGRAILIHSVLDFSPAFEQIANELQAQYVLTYFPSAPPKGRASGKFNLKVLRPKVKISFQKKNSVPAH